MQVIMIKTGQLKEVPDGYARNYLFPHRLAKPATESGVQEAKATQEKVAAELKAKAASNANLVKQLATTALTISAPANEQGKLFAAIKVEQVQAALSALQLTVDADTITLPVIKKTGEHFAQIAIPGQASCKVAINITAQ